VHHVISQLVYACARSQVSKVWVAGKAVYASGSPVHLNKLEVADRAREWGQKLRLSQQSE